MKNYYLTLLMKFIIEKKKVKLLKLALSPNQQFKHLDIY